MLRVAALLFALTIALGFAVMAGWFGAVDHALSALAGLRAGQDSQQLIDTLWWVSWAGGGTPRWIIVTALCGALWWAMGWRAGAAMAMASLLSNMASNAFKFSFGRVRPDIIPHLDHVGSPAYPSGHATSAAAVYLLLALMVPPRWRGAALVAAVSAMALNGASRLMLGVHWATDIIGGTMLGSGFALIACWWWQQAARQNGHSR